MNGNMLKEVISGVLKIESNEIGPDEVEYEGNTYFRFMDYFYIQNKNLDELEPEQVSNLCRARAMYPNLISDVNLKVREIFRELTNTMRPSTLLEIGAGQNPLLEVDDIKPTRYILADADTSVVSHYAELNNECYAFSKDICNIPNLENFFEMAIAVFVLHFPFHKNQFLELSKRLNPAGVIVANVYRRSVHSREKLTHEIKDSGFEIFKVNDGGNLCRDHEYWVLGKTVAHVKNCASILENIIKK